MNIYFLFNNDSSNDWYGATIEAWVENDNSYIGDKKVSSFSMIERLRIHVTKPGVKYHCASLDHEFGTDACTGHFAKSKKAFMKDKIGTGSFQFKKTNYKNFQRFKKVMLAIYAKYPPVNYTEMFAKIAPGCRILF